MKVAFIVLAHHRPAQLALLLRSLRHPNARTYLHIDRQSRMTRFRSALATSGITDIDLLPRHRHYWGSIGIVDAALDGLQRALIDGCGYFVLLSGQDFPLRPIGETVDFFADSREETYVEYFPLPDSRWAYGGRMRTDFYSYDLFGRRETCFPKGEEPSLSVRGRILNSLLRAWTAQKPPRRFPSYARPFGGWTWWNLSRTAAKFVLQFVREHPDYRAYHQHALLPDELFFQSILMGTPFGQAHRVVNDSLRFMIWPAGKAHPKTLVSQDLPAMRESRHPFARKFDIEIDRSVIEKLQV
jgi:hypothetical protein